MEALGEPESLFRGNQSSHLHAGAPLVAAARAGECDFVVVFCPREAEQVCWLACFLSLCHLLHAAVTGLHYQAVFLWSCVPQILYSESRRARKRSSRCASFKVLRKHSLCHSCFTFSVLQTLPSSMLCFYELRRTRKMGYPNMSFFFQNLEKILSPFHVTNTCLNYHGVFLW